MDSTTLRDTLNGTPAKRKKTNDAPLPFVTPHASQLEEDVSDDEERTPLDKSDIQQLLLREANYDIDNPENTQKRSNYLSWDEYFFGIVFLSAQRSKDPTTPTGACIVDSDNCILGIGYNGFARNCSDDVLPWQDNSTNLPWLYTREPYECHAEVNAILNKCSANVKGARLYVAHFPCDKCAKVIIQSNIREVIYMEDNHPDTDEYKASRVLLEMARVKTRQYQPTISSIMLDIKSEMDDTPAPNPRSTMSTEEKERIEDMLKDVLDKFDPSKVKPAKRLDYISWDDYFMAIAFLTAKRSKDPNTQVGACIVDSQKRIIGVGYNGFPRGCSDDYLPWGRSAELPELHRKYLYVTHAEVNAILNKCSDTVEGATLYVALFPCNECAKMIIQAGIKEVVYLSDRYHDTDACCASRTMFAMAGVRLRRHEPERQVVSIEFKKGMEN